MVCHEVTFLPYSHDSALVDYTCLAPPTWRSLRYDQPMQQVGPIAH